MSDEGADKASFSARAQRALERLRPPFEDDRAERPPPRLGAFFGWAFRGLRWPLAAHAVASLSVGLIEVAILVGVGQLVDRATAAGADAFFETNSGFLLGLGALILIARPLMMTAMSFFASLVVGPALIPGVMWRLHRYALGHSMRYFDDDFAGRLAQKEMQAAGATDTITIDLLNAVGMLASFMIGMVAALAAADWRLGLLGLLWLPAYAVLLRAMLPRIRRNSRRSADSRAQVSGQLVDALSNIKTVKLFAAPGEEERAARATLMAYRARIIAVGLSITSFRGLLNLFNGVAMAALLGMALWLWGVGATTIGVVAAATMLVFRLTQMSGWIAFMLLGIFRELGALEDALGTLAVGRELQDAKTPAALPMIAPSRVAGEPERIRFENVAFSYAAEARDGPPPVPAVRGLSLDIAPGERVGLVGPSGAGKSTLAALLLRLYDVSSGRITLGGTDIRSLRQAELRARIGVVTQEAALFNRSALDNILYGRPEAGPAAAYAAAERAAADAFIHGLEDVQGRRGYDAHLGERGVKLSGGQRQRIALARVFLKDAPILLLDEATSALDSEVEAAILEAMDDLMRDKTVIAIAHRLSTLAAMDRIIVLDHGRIIEEGAHDALLRRGGLYAGLWSRQSGGFIAAGAAAAE